MYRRGSAESGNSELTHTSIGSVQSVSALRLGLNSGATPLHVQHSLKVTLTKFLIKLGPEKKEGLFDYPCHGYRPIPLSKDSA